MTPLRIAGRTTTALVALCALSACAVGPNFHRPAAPADAGYSAQPLPDATVGTEAAGGEAQRFVQGLDIPAMWWTLFRSEALNALIDDSLKHNPDLAAAKAALRVAQENYYSQEGSLFPQVGADFSANRNQNAGQPSPTLASNQLRFDLYTAQLNISYVLDIFGGERRQIETARAQAEAQQYQLEAAFLTLTSNVAVTAIQEASLRAQIAATADVIRAEQDALDILKRELALGQVAGADVAAQEAALAQAQATLPPLQKQLEQERDLLTTLTGRYPNQAPAQIFTLDGLHLPEDLPVSIASKLVDQRPDVRQAEANLHAATAQVGVAIANMLPQFTLSANPGTVAVEASQMFSSGNYFWSIAGNVAQPIFEGGALLHKTKAARAALDQALDQYHSTVVVAFQNVADALHALAIDADALKANLASERAAADSLGIARRRLELGDISYLALLNAEQTYQQAVVARVQAEAGRYADTVALFQALGGGWWNRQDELAQANP